MMFLRKKLQEDIPLEETAIWSCVNEDCNGWMRVNFVFEAEPICRQCQSQMIKGIRMLPVLLNNKK